MDICLICYEEKPLITVHDSCRYCADCVFGWLYTLAINNKNVHGFTLAACPTQSCVHQRIMVSFSSELPDTLKAQLNDIYFRNYVSKTSDLLECPNPSCGRAGFTISSHFGCRTPFECEYCEHQWTHPIIGGSSERACQRFKTYIVKEFISKRCPHCQTYIIRNDGCNTVYCPGCDKRFPWVSVFRRGWLMLFLLLFTPAFAVLCYFYKDIVDWADENGLIAEIGLWALHVVLFHMCIYFMVRYVATVRICLENYKSMVARGGIILFTAAIPVAGLIGLNYLLQDYYKFWISIGVADLLIGAVVVALVGACFIFISIRQLIELSRGPPQDGISAPLTINDEARIGDNKDIKEVEEYKNGDDIEAHREHEPIKSLH